MINITQILPSTKTADAKNTTLNFTFDIESYGKPITEYNVFDRISQLDQFYTEKGNCDNFRFSGNINEIVNLKYNLPRPPVIKPNFTHFDLTLPANWDVMLMAPLQIGDGAQKGDTTISVTNNGVTKTLDLTQGLPALAIQAQLINNKTRNGLLLYLGHNLQENDAIYITETIGDSRYTSGTYRVVMVQGNEIYIQPITSNTSTAVASPPVDTPVSPMVIIDGIELGITQDVFNVATGRTDVNWLAIYNPHVFVTKIVDKMPCEYYLKRLYFLGYMDDLYYCAYANNSFGQPTYLYIKDKKLNFAIQTSNLKAPLTDVYVVARKLVHDVLDMTTVQASFSNFITATFNYGGIQSVSFHYESENGNDIDYSNQLNFLYYNLTEYDPLALQENEIAKVEHTFLCNITDQPIRFSYNPFTEIPIRKFSNTITEWDPSYILPVYAVYSDKFQTYRWRYILDIGYYESQGNGIDFPYLNDAFYVNTNIMLNVRNYASPMVPSMLTGGYLLSAYTDTLTQTTQPNTTGYAPIDDSLLDQNKFDKPFQQYSGIIC
jgi:hypothetical protein